MLGDRGKTGFLCLGEIGDTDPLVFYLYDKFVVIDGGGEGYVPLALWVRVKDCVGDRLGDGYFDFLDVGDCKVGGSGEVATAILTTETFEGCAEKTMDMCLFTIRHLPRA